MKDINETLAKWMGLEHIVYLDAYKMEGELAYVSKKGAYLSLDVWQPDKDANQLEMLELKMIEDAKINVITYRRHIPATSPPSWEIRYFKDVDLLRTDISYYAMIGRGKTTAEAKLNAIYQYAVEQLKVQK